MWTARGDGSHSGRTDRLHAVEVHALEATAARQVVGVQVDVWKTDDGLKALYFQGVEETQAL